MVVPVRWSILLSSLALLHCGVTLPDGDSGSGSSSGSVTTSSSCGDGGCVTFCSDGYAWCTDQCVDLRTDWHHCGYCDQSCRTGQYCSAGQCHSRSGSCPYVFLWDGTAYAYSTDLSGSPLAAGLDFFRPEFYGLNVYELGTWGPAQGVYRMRLRELIFEASYFDLATLVLADVPEGHEVYNTWSSTPQLGRFPTRDYVSMRGPRVPVTAVDDAGRDVRAAVLAVDGVPAPVDAAGLPRVTVDFGRTEHPERARLLLTTWGVYQDFRQTQKPPYSGGTTVEVPDGNGGWAVRRVGGKSASDARTWVLDLAGVLEGPETKLRITLAHQPSTLDVLDAVALDDSEPVEVELHRLAPAVAQLGYGGAGHAEAATLTQRIVADDVLRQPDPDAFLAGRYTRYGDVRPLLLQADDRFVLMAHGDELLLQWDAPPLAPGKTRRSFLEADVFYSLKYHPFGILTETVEPLPFHGMPRYPYPPDAWPYRDDADYQDYLETWNTREIGPSGLP